MVYVCDAIMGSGKTEAAIAYINKYRGEKKFVYATPYLTEVERVKQGTSFGDEYDMVAPCALYGRDARRKKDHFLELLRDGENIVTTHATFKSCQEEHYQLLREYTVIIDESIETIGAAEPAEADIDMLITSKYIIEDGEGRYMVNPELGYEGKVFKNFFTDVGQRGIIKNLGVKSDNPKNCIDYYFWQLPPELFTSSKDTIILTYLFSGQTLSYMFQMTGIEYQKLYINKYEDESGPHWEFTHELKYIPEYVKNLPQMINLVPETDRLCQIIGKRKTDLSMGWFSKNGGKLTGWGGRTISGVKQIADNGCNFFGKRIGKRNSDEFMWSTYKTCNVYKPKEDDENQKKTPFEKMKTHGHLAERNFVPFNLRASNDYRNKTALAYFVNIFMNVGEKLLYQSHGVEVDEDAYALNFMIQWIWRSAIRDGKTIDLYIPSKRMRDLFVNWMNAVAGEARELGA